MATNSTTYYNLPVFAAGDKPKWLVDWNTTMNLIDSAIAAAKAAGDNAQITANANAVAITGLNESVSTMSTALGTLTTNVTTLTGNVQRINELIGNGTPTTQDKTIIGAINELKAAIDALAPGGAVQADEVEYDNTNSGLTATNVQDAIDELAQGGGSGGADLNFTVSETATVTAVVGTVNTSFTEVNILTNADGSIGKVYGTIDINGPASLTGNAWNKVAKIQTTKLPAIAESYNILTGFTNVFVTSSTFNNLRTRLVFNTDKSIDVELYGGGSTASYAELPISLSPCLYILKDLGD